MPKRLFLVDGSNHAFRVQFALPPRHTSDGFPTRVLYGFTLLFQKMMRTWKPDFVAVSFDTGGNFREAIYPAYKGHRPEMPEDLRQQWGSLPEIVEGFGYKAIVLPGFEADDVLGTLARAFPGEDLEVYFVTSDKDFAQLVDDRTRILDEGKNQVLGPAEVEEKFGIGPGGIIDMLALAGDSSDNVPGVAGVGMKTAVKFLKEHGDLDGVLAAAAAGRIKGKTGQRLVDEAGNARMSKDLVTIRTDVDLGLSLDDLRPRPLDEEALRTLFDRWEFGTVARKLLPDREAMSLAGVRAPVGDDAVAALGDITGPGPWGVAVGIEEDADTPWAGTPVSVAFVDEAGAGIVVSLDDPAVRARAFTVLADPGVSKWVHHHKRAYKALAAHGGALAGVVGDTRLLDYVLTPHRRQHSLEDLAGRDLGHTLGSAASASDLPDPLGVVAEEARLVAALHPVMEARLDDGRASIYRELEVPLAAVLGDMEARGIALDTDRLAAIDVELASRLEAVEARCHALAGKSFNVRSRKEIAAILFDELGLPPSKKLKDGWSTASPVLEALVEQHDLPQAILDYRELDKLRGTYVTKLPEYVAPDGRVHTTLHQAVAATGRLSSVDPNLQNIPVRTFEGRRIRECFVPADGCVFVSADYSQVELRVLAHVTGDPVLIEGFRAGEDIHRRTAVELFGVAPDSVGVAERSAAKAINFGLLYGMSAFRLARDLRIGRDEAQAHMDRYFERMPQVRDWIEATKARAREEGQVETLYGRKRTIPEIHSNQFNERAAGEREAVNTVIQGTAADLIKRAMLRVAAALPAAGLRARMVLQVHDELLVEAPEAEVDAVCALVSREMAAAGDLVVPLVVNTSVGRTWNEAHG